MREHLRQLAHAGVGTVSVSWYPHDQSDEQLVSLPGMVIISP